MKRIYALVILLNLSVLLNAAAPLQADSKNLIKKIAKEPALKNNYLPFYEAQAALQKNQTDKAISLLQTLLSQNNLSDYLKTKANRSLGRAYCESKNHQRADGFYRKLIHQERQSTQGIHRVAFWQLAQAKCLIKQKENVQNFEILRQLYLQDSQGQISEDVLAILANANTSQIISPQEHIQKGRRLLKDRPQLASLSLAAAAASYAVPPLSLQRDLATAYFRSRQYPKAAVAYANLKNNDPGAWDSKSALRLAQAYARSDQFNAAIKAYKALYGHSGHKASTLDYKIAYLLMDKGELNEANRHFSALLQQYPKHRHRAKIYWFLAWNHYQLKNYNESLVYLETLNKNFSRSAYAKRAPYWRARIADKQDQQTLANRYYRAITNRAPDSYYGLLSEWRLGGDFPKELKVPAPHHTPPAQALLAGLTQNKNQQNILYALYDLKLWDDFFGELQGVLHSRSFTEFLSPAERQGYPRPYIHWVKLFSARYQIPTALIYAIMREESRFNPSVVSHAAAIGLMQIIPPTGLEIAQDLNRQGFEKNWLTEPLINIEFGTYYLSKNAKRFEESLPQTIASYNAGPEAVTRWITARPGRPWDEFVEEIPYRETHNYVKKVLKSYQRYGGM